MKTKAMLIPLDTASTPNEFSVEKRASRKHILDELRCIPAIVNIAKELPQGEIYRIVYHPEGAKLFKDSTGDIKGVFYKDGKIVEHARFRAVRPSFVKVASAVGAQILLISIAMQLNRIEKEIARLQVEFHSDRISEINSGITLYQQAANASSPENRRDLTIQAIAILHTGIEKTLTELKRLISEAPSAETSFFDNWITDKSEIAKEKFTMMDEAFLTSLNGIKTLADCYVIIEEPLSAASALRSCLDKLDLCDINLAAVKARLVPVTESKPYPEESWNTFLSQRAQVEEKISEYVRVANGDFERIEIEINPEEILEKNNGKMF